MTRSRNNRKFGPIETYTGTLTREEVAELRIIRRAQAVESEVAAFNALLASVGVQVGTVDFSAPEECKEDYQLRR